MKISTRRVQIALAGLIALASVACSSPTDPSGYYHRSGRTVHSDTFPDYNRDGYGRYGRYPVGIPRGHF